jgi:ankyrin repeat protein
MELGADVNHSTADGNTALIMAVYQGQVDAMRCLVKELGADVNQKNCQGSTALLEAIRRGDVESVRTLVKELGADVNLSLPDGGTPLIVASGLQNEKIVKLLLKAGADAQASVFVEGTYFTAADGAAANGASAELKEYLEAKLHCSNLSCSGAGIQKCAGCKQARYCGQACQLAHWPVHKADCKARQAKAISAK